MNRLSASFWLVALLGVAVLATLWFRTDRRLRDVSATLASAQARGIELESHLAGADRQKVILTQRIASLEAELTQARAELATANDHTARLTRELTQTTADLTAGNDMRRAMEQHIAGLERDLAAARLAIVPAETIEGYRTTIAELERQLAAAHAGAAIPGAAGASTAVFATASPVAARVLSVGPANSFVVLDYGGDRGAAVGQRLVIKSGTETLAEVLISDVRNLLCIAQVRPDSLRGVLHKGDSAVLTN
ncbi:hypothetical protein [Opitutus terrae]|uniref:hypothetical protein n=1 Tax=Opitutus terrae TaxID=107709 RepID=UPI00030A9970|nr:hypothetical protein [Opitutus terrae]